MVALGEMRVAALLSGLLAAPVQQSTAGDIGWVDIRGPDGVAPSDRQSLQESLVGPLRRAGYRVRHVQGNADDKLQWNVVQVLRAEIQKKGPDFYIQVEVTVPRSGETIAIERAVCEICGIGELIETVEGVSSRIEQKLKTAALPTRIRVTSEPPGATVKLDGQSVGTTPVAVVSRPGEHHIEISKSGFRVEQTESKIEPGVITTFSFNLARQEKRAVVPAWLPWTALGVGLATTIAGAALLAVHGRPIRSDCNPDPDGNCQYLHDTIVGGAVTTSVGVALVGAGIGLAVVRARRARVDVALSNAAIRF